PEHLLGFSWSLNHRLEFSNSGGAFTRVDGHEDVFNVLNADAHGFKGACLGQCDFPGICLELVTYGLSKGVVVFSVCDKLRPIRAVDGVTQEGSRRIKARHLLPIHHEHRMLETL